MPKPGEQGGAPEEQPAVGAFGEPTVAPGAEPTAADISGEEGKKPEGEGEGKGEGKEGDQGKPQGETPTQRIERLAREKGDIESKYNESEGRHKTKDENLQKANDAIRDLRIKLAKYEGGGDGGEGAPEGSPVLFKDVKTSKDLTAEEKEDMTKTELAQFDEIASLKTGMNQLAAMMSKGAAAGDDKGGDGTGGEAQPTDVQGAVKTAATALADGDTDMANQIIEAAKLFSFEGLTADQVKERVAIAAKTVPDYKAPKEQGGTGGKGKPAGGGKESDPHNVDHIVEEAHKGAEAGGYAL